jgi:zinc protease
MADLKRMTVEDLRTWYERWYAPNNATLVVVGDVTVDEVRTLAERYFGPIKKQDVPNANRPLELDEPGERRLRLHVQTQVPSLIMAFNTPSLATSEKPRQIHALRLISALLDGGYSARLPQQLERGEELVTSASAWYNAYARGDTLFALSAAPNMQKGRTLEEVEAGLWKQLEQLKETAPSAEELERVRAQVIAGLVYERDSITQQATTIGQLETVGLSWRLMDEELSALEAVTPEDIQQAARTYFTRSRLSAAHVLPEESSDE